MSKARSTIPYHGGGPPWMESESTHRGCLRNNDRSQEREREGMSEVLPSYGPFSGLFRSYRKSHPRVPPNPGTRVRV